MALSRNRRRQLLSGNGLQIAALDRGGSPSRPGSWLTAAFSTGGSEIRPYRVPSRVVCAIASSLHKFQSRRYL